MTDILFIRLRPHHRWWTGSSSVKPVNVVTTDSLNIVTKGANESESVVSVSFDMTKGIDYVLHHRLLVQIESYIVANPVLALMFSYLISGKKWFAWSEILHRPTRKPLQSNKGISLTLCVPLRTLMKFHVIKHGAQVLYADNVKAAQFIYPSTPYTIIDKVVRDLPLVGSNKQKNNMRNQLKPELKTKATWWRPLLYDSYLFYQKVINGPCVLDSQKRQFELRSANGSWWS